MGGESQATKNRRIRQEGLREQLSNKGLLQQVIESTNKIADLDIELSAHDLNRLKVANDHRLAIVKKYLPDLKLVDAEITGADGAPIETDNKYTIEFVSAVSKDS